MRLTKHHGLGNDFLVALGDVHVEPEQARQLCDRRRGIGADGLIVGSPGQAGADVEMTLFNSDGSRAQISGNGVRCLAQAVALERGTPHTDLVVHTDAGLRAVAVRPGCDRSTVDVRVDMGEVGAGPTWDPSPEACALLARLRDGDGRAGTVGMGNPHLVVHVPDPWRVDLRLAGPTLERDFPDGVNVEFIAPTAGRADELDLTVWERGAGVTEACGTGACAGVAQARAWGLVGSQVRVHMPGGDVEVHLADRVTLIGPSVFIARIEVDLA